MKRSEVVTRSLVTAVALIATASGAPPWVSAPLALLSLANGGQLLAYLAPREDPVERCLLAAGGLTVLLILLGVVLNYVPGGLTPSSYAVGWALISWALLGSVSRREGVGGVGWLRGASISIVASLGVLAAASAVAFRIAAAGLSKQAQQPVLALSSPAYGATEAQILISSLNAGGVYELLVLPDGARRGASARLVTLGARGSHGLELGVHLPPARCYWRVTLRPRGSRGVAERELILWAGTSSAGLQHSRVKMPPLAAASPRRRNASGSCVPSGPLAQ
jgi:hypothetical protein